MCIQFQDHLLRQLHLSEENILFLQSNILNRCDRREVLFFSADDLDTVLDLMRHVESALPQHVRDTDGTGGADGRAARGRREGDRLPAELLERRALPADGGLHGAPVPGRRRGDFSGTRRRSSDQPRMPRSGLPAPPAAEPTEGGSGGVETGLRPSSKPVDGLCAAAAGRSLSAGACDEAGRMNFARRQQRRHRSAAVWFVL